MSDETENTEREVLNLHIGSSGCEIGHQCWELYCLEHNLDVNGCPLSEENPPHCFFTKSNDHNATKYHPRALFIDFDSTDIDRIKTSNLKNIYDNNKFLIATESSDDLLVMDNIRKQIEICDHFQGFILSHSTFGKSSTFTSKLIHNLRTDYSKMTILTNSIIGSSIDICHMSDLLKNAHVVIPMENQAIFNLCKYRLDISTPTYCNINRLIALCWSHLTCSMRFDGCLLGNLHEFQTTSVPFPSLNIISSYLLPLIPFVSSKTIDFQSPSVYDMCVPLFSQLHTCFLNRQDTHRYKMVLAVCLLFRGENIIPKEIGQKLICDMKKWIRFSDQTPTGFRCGINYHRPYVSNDQSDIARTDKQVLMLTNETSTSKYLCHMALNQMKTSRNENQEITEARNYLQEVQDNYDKYEKEIIGDNQLDLTTSLT